MTRHEVLEKIELLWNKYPDVPLGQLICSCKNLAMVYYASNEELLHILSQVFQFDFSQTIESESQISPKKFVFIHKDNECKRISSNDLTAYIAAGWKSGRKRKNK